MRSAAVLAPARGGRKQRVFERSGEEEEEAQGSERNETEITGPS